MTDVLVYGASEHGKYTIDIIEQQGLHRVVGVVDDRVPVGTELYGYPVLGTGDDLRVICDDHGVHYGVVAIGDNFVRQRIAERIVQQVPEFEFITAIHPFTSIGRDTTIGAGTVLMAGAVVNGSCSVGQHCFIATSASLDHDSTLGDFVSMSPNSATGGGVVVGPFSTISMGASVMHGVHIGEHTVVGAGSTVTKDLPDRVVAYGTPCRVVRPREVGDRYL